MRRTTLGFGIAAVAICIAILTVLLYAVRATQALEPNQVGEVATRTTLDAIRAADTPHGVCFTTTTLCSANVPCIARTGGCQNGGAYCTNGLVQGSILNQACNFIETELFCSLNPNAAGCFESFRQCEANAGGCSCTRVVEVGQFIDTHSVC